jgi:hypothetical protein
LTDYQKKKNENLFTRILKQDVVFEEISMKYSRPKKYPYLLNCLLAALLLCSTASLSLAATYTADPTETTNGGSSWGKEILLFKASIDGSDATFTVSNVDSNATIPSDGMMFLNSGDAFRTTKECDNSETIMSNAGLARNPITV